MQTRCPECGTLFVARQQLIGALDARARCGICRAVFNARDCLLQEPAQDEEIPSPDRVSQPVPPEIDFAFETTNVSDQDDTVHFGGGAQLWGDSVCEDHSWNDELEPIASENRVDVDAENVQENEITWQDDDDTLALLRQTKPPAFGRNGWWFLGCVFLSLAIAGQWVYNKRTLLMSEPQARPVLQKVCDYMGCQLEPLRNLDKIELLRHSVYSHPNIDKALIISLSMVNNASYAQPFPVLVIHMANVRGEIIARREITPGNYLDASIADDLMSLGAPVTVSLEVHDPGNDALTFELAFR